MAEKENFELKINSTIMREELNTLQELNDYNARELQKLTVELEQKACKLKENEELIHQLRGALVIAGERMQTSHRNLQSNTIQISDKDSLITELRGRLAATDEQLEAIKVKINTIFFII